MAIESGKSQVYEDVQEDAREGDRDEERPAELPVDAEVDPQHEFHVTNKVIHAIDVVDPDSFNDN
ncbi:hypothetical protein QHH03_31935, partial [Aphanizomenon sp. 202]|nr:hypothetical protein [Aphanizomenon sp. 202]